MSPICQLPPLILHPFGGGNSFLAPDDSGEALHAGSQLLVEGSRAALALQGLISSPEDEFELNRKVLAGRYQEIRMLLFLGKDLFRWLQQCVDCIQRSAEADPRVNEQSFAAFLVEEPPSAVREKLEKWGVTDRRAVFSRAIGVNSLFNTPPPMDSLSPTLMKNYHRFADHAYICFQHLRPFFAIDAKHFSFEIYASEEYSRLLSEQWEQDSSG
jgi:hypothetical protein